MEARARRELWFWRVVILGPLIAFGLWIAAYVFAPQLSPVLPRPGVVPWRGASAHWDWKGSGGLAWTWCETTPSGKVQWGAFDGGEEVRMTLIVGAACAARPQDELASRGDAVMWDRADRRDTLYYRSLDWGRGWRGGGAPCGFAVPAERLRALRQVATEAQGRTRNARRAEHLAALIRSIDETRGDALIASAGSGSMCTSGPE